MGEQRTDPHQTGRLSAPHRLAAVADRHRRVPCKGTLGSRPSWMSPDQYDPCHCRLIDGHDGPHWCEHLGSEPPDGLLYRAPAFDRGTDV